MENLSVICLNPPPSPPPHPFKNNLATPLVSLRPFLGMRESGGDFKLSYNKRVDSLAYIYFALYAPIAHYPDAQIVVVTLPISLSRGLKVFPCPSPLIPLLLPLPFSLFVRTKPLFIVVIFTLPSVHSRHSGDTGRLSRWGSSLFSDWNWMPQILQVTSISSHTR